MFVLADWNFRVICYAAIDNKVAFWEYFIVVKILVYMLFMTFIFTGHKKQISQLSKGIELVK